MYLEKTTDENREGKNKSKEKSAVKRKIPKPSTILLMSSKLNYGKKTVCGDVGQMIDTHKHNLKHDLVNNMEEWKCGLAFKTVYQGANKYISNTSTIGLYENAAGAVKDYYQKLKSDVDIPAPPRVRLRSQTLHNINDVHNAILQVI